MFSNYSCLRDCRRLFLRNHKVDAYIGVYAFEQKSTQRILIDLDVYIPLSKSTPLQDELAEVFDYEVLRAAIAQLVARGHISLLETLCDNIAQAILAHPSVLATRVSATKPDIYAGCETVGVEVIHFKPQLNQS